MEVLRGDMKVLQEEVAQIKLKINENRVILDLLVKRLDIIDNMIATQIRHDEKIKATSRDIDDIWTELNRNKDRLSSLRSNIASTKAAGEVNSKVLMSGPKWAIAGLSLLVTTVVAAWQIFGE